MIKLFKNGKELCEVVDYNFYQGKQKINHLKPIGGIPNPRIPIPGKKDVDRVEFVVPMRLNLDKPSKYELRDNEGNITSINILNIHEGASRQNQSIVNAVIEN